MATRQDIFNILQRVKYLPNSPINEKNVDQIVEMFFVILKDLSFDLLDKAALFYLGQDVPYFPMPGKIRSKALELQMIALKIPTPAEAWGMVIKRNRHQPGVICQVSAQLRKEIEGVATSGEYFLLIKKITSHESECRVCKPTTFNSEFAHPMVERTVKILGGLDAILSDNPVADRARFVQAYSELLEREISIVGMTSDVREFVDRESTRLLEDRRNAFETNEREYVDLQFKRLAKGMS